MNKLTLAQKIRIKLILLLSGKMMVVLNAKIIGNNKQLTIEIPNTTQDFIVNGCEFYTDDSIGLFISPSHPFA